MVPAEFYLDKSVATVAQVYYRVAFESVLISVVEYLAFVGLRIYAQVAYAERLKYKSECIEVVDKVVRSQT